MDILELVKQSRQTIEHLFLAIESTQQTQKLYEYFNNIYEELTTYLQAEELTLYTSLDKHKETKELIQTAEAEHQEAKSLLEELEFFSPTSSEFKEKLQTLKQLITTHWEKEDNLIFVQAQKLASKQEQEQLGKTFITLKNRLQRELSMS